MYLTDLCDHPYLTFHHSAIPTPCYSFNFFFFNFYKGNGIGYNFLHYCVKCSAINLSHKCSLYIGLRVFRTRQDQAIWMRKHKSAYKTCRKRLKSLKGTGTARGTWIWG